MDALIQAAMEAVEAARAKAERDPKRPVFHYRPPAQHMNDVCGALNYRGWYHIFFQFDPYSDQGGHPGWGHARSRDLVHWEHLPIAIMPDVEKGERLYASGSAVLDDRGIPIIFFGWTPQAVWDRTAKREQWAAVPTDEELIEWRKLEIGLRPGESGVPTDIRHTWTDMFVFRSRKCSFATFKSSKGLVCEALNPELTRWQAVGHIDEIVGECPNFFPLEDKWVLIQSTYPISYQIGQFDPETIRFTADGPTRPLDYAYGSEKPGPRFNGLYGTTATVDDQDRTLFFGYISRFEESRGWNGCMALPRVLSLDGSGNLVQTPIRELEQLRERPIHIMAIGLDNESRKLKEISGDCLEISVTVVPGDCRICGLRLRCSEDGHQGVVVAARGTELDVAGTKVPEANTKDDEIDLHMYIDKSVLETFIDGGRKTVTRVIQADIQNLGIALFSDNGTALFKDLKIWPIKPVWPR